MRLGQVFVGAAVKALSSPLLALFAADTHFEQFDLYTFSLSSGAVLRYSSCSFDVVYGGNTYLCARSPGGIVIDEQGDGGPRAEWTSGLDVGSWSVMVMPRPTDVIGVLPWLWAARVGIFDEATIRVDRAYVTNWPATPTLTLVPIGLVNVFYGRTAGIDFGRSSVQINMNDHRELLAIDMPRNLYTASCRYALFGPGCTLTKSSFTVGTTVTGSTNNQFLTTTDVHPADYFSLGSVLFNTGANAGLELMVRQSYSNGSLSLLTPFPFLILNGDTATLTPGCDHVNTTCAAKFGNLLNFGGFPYIPAAETSM
jgi:uncharacterized phage protein (TIGR02218 family)